MPVELRKRKAPPPAPEPPAKKPSKVAKAAAKVKDAIQDTVAKVNAAANGSNAAAAAAAAPKHAGGKPVEGDVISLDGFGGDVHTQDGNKTTLKALVDESKAGVVLFTYPKASTPGCTTQACLFRDSYEPLTAGGLAIYGLSTDSPKANTTFKEKQKLPYPLLCDPQATLIGAIGLKKAPKGTTRGVFVVNKAGKVLASTPGGPAATVDVVKELVTKLAGGEGDTAPAGGEGDTAPAGGEGDTVPAGGEGDTAPAAAAAAEPVATAAPVAEEADAAAEPIADKPAPASVVPENKEDEVAGLNGEAKDADKTDEDKKDD